jgi:hypothetical protein
MSGFPIIDLIAGIIFVYFLLSIVCSSVVEMLLAGFRARAKLLAEWLYKIFDQQVQVGGKTESLGQAIMDHCAVTALSEKGNSPSYIDAKNFSSALLEKITFNPNNPNDIANDLNAIISQLQQTNILSPELKRALLTYAYEAKELYKNAGNKVMSEIEVFRSKIETWYDTSMERLTGDFKRRYSRPFTLIVATVTVLLMNADTVNIAKYLYSNPEARAKIAAQAYTAAQDSANVFNQRIAAIQNANDTTVKQLQQTFQTGLDNINDAKAVIEQNLPFGWNTTDFKTLKNFFVLLSKVLGLVVTILAIMLGTPFWFDLLNKVTNLRSTGNKPGTDTSASTTTAAIQPAPISVTVSSNRDEEAVG